MQILFSFLRGVNMAGHNKIKMADLSALCKKLGLKDVETYIQSGNLIFSSPENAAIDKISSEIESAILKEFGYNIPVLIRTSDEIQKIIFSNPFLGENNFDPTKLAVMFLTDKPGKSQIEKMQDVSYPPDKFRIIGKEIFVYCPNGFGKTKLYTNFFEKKMNIIATGRNLNTVKALLEIAKDKLNRKAD